MLIEKISSPANIKTLSISDLNTLANEIRSVIIERVSLNGGHLASNLGVVELTLALHYVFDSPFDKLIWDVGHQSYPHKLITGRYEQFHTLRKHGGLSGFPKISESPHDAFGTGHSSTSISAGLGMAVARDISMLKFGSSPCGKVIAIIGDGALTSGLAFEALNHAGHLKTDLLVILNDNEMSISPNVGALSNYLNKTLVSSFFRKVRKETKSFLEGLPRIGERAARLAQKAEGSIKGFFTPGGLFVDLGFNYVGPIDGHDVSLLIETLKGIKELQEPILLHIVTTKGKGYKFSEEDPCMYHGIGPFNTSEGIKPTADDCFTYSEIFGKTLTELADEDPKIVAITAAMTEGTGLSPFASKHKDRFFDVGIAEPHAVTFAGGLASQGLKPVVAIYSSFLQRAYDEIIHDVCLQNLPVVFAVDRAGIVGEDGSTHQGLFDISFLSSVPNLVIMSPKDGSELIEMLKLALSLNKPVAIRYPRAKTFIHQSKEQYSLNFAEAEILTEGTDCAVIATGITVSSAMKSAEMLKSEGINIRVINMRFLKPLDEDVVVRSAKECGCLLTVEENVLAGGLGSAVLQCLAKHAIWGVKVKTLGIDDVFVEHGSQTVLRSKYGLDSLGVCTAVKALLAR